MGRDSSFKVVTRILGGLGNQLFCYAAARRLALVNDAELVLDHKSGFVRDYKYNRKYLLHHFNIKGRIATSNERFEPCSFVRRSLRQKIELRSKFEDRSMIVQEGVDFDPRLLAFKLRGSVYLQGYWQSEGYFKDVESLIREDLRIRPPQDSVNQKTVELIRSCTAIAVHLRFFEAPEYALGENAPRDYYLNAIAQMENRVPDAHYFVFSDRPSLARDLIPLSEDRMTVLNHNHGDENAYADLWLMTQCKHFIIANSTFSWWGAWLSESDCKIIIAPSFTRRTGQGVWGFEGLLPTDWIKI